MKPFFTATAYDSWIHYNRQLFWNNLSDLRFGIQIESLQSSLKSIEERFPDSKIRQLSSSGDEKDYQTLYKLVFCQVFAIHMAYCQAIINSMYPEVFSKDENELELSNLVDENLEEEVEVAQAMADADRILNSYNPITCLVPKFSVSEIIICLNRLLNGYLKAVLAEMSKLLKIQIIPYLVKYCKTMKHEPEQKIIEICKNWRFRRLLAVHYLIKNQHPFKDK